jgi:hypothetical protein
MLNAGKSGDTSAQVLARLDAAVPAGTSIGSARLSVRPHLAQTWQ